MEQTRKQKFKRLRALRLRSTSYFTQSFEVKPVPHQATLRSIARSIKDQSLAGLVQRYSTERRVDNSCTSQNNLGVDQGLIELRKKYDSVRNNNDLTERNVRRMKEEIANLQAELQQLTVKGPEEREHEIEDSLSLAYRRLEDLEWGRKSYKYLEDRLKEDKMSYTLRRNRLELEHRLLHLAEHQGKKKIVLGNQVAHQAERLRKELGQQCASEQKDMAKARALVEEDLNKQESEAARQDQRQREVDLIAEATMQDKDWSEKQWRKLLSVHLMLRKLLKIKIESQMRKFQLVENAYQQIKTSTGVADANEIVRRFLTRESTYGNLLASIADAQKRIEQEKKKNDELVQSLKKLREVVPSIDLAGKKGDAHLLEAVKGLQRMEYKNQKSVLYMEKLYLFTKRVGQKLAQVKGGTFKPDRKALPEQVKKLAESAVQLLEEVNPEQYKEFTYSVSPGLEQEAQAANYRVGKGEESDQQYLDDTEEPIDLDVSLAKVKRRSK